MLIDKWFKSDSIDSEDLSSLHDSNGKFLRYFITTATREDIYQVVYETPVAQENIETKLFFWLTLNIELESLLIINKFVS